MTGAQMLLFDQRVSLANWYLGAHLWALLTGQPVDAAFYAERANVIDGECRRMCGL